MRGLPWQWWLRPMSEQKEILLNMRSKLCELATTADCGTKEQDDQVARIDLELDRISRGSGGG